VLLVTFAPNNELTKKIYLFLKTEKLKLDYDKKTVGFELILSGFRSYLNDSDFEDLFTTYLQTVENKLSIKKKTSLFSPEGFTTRLQKAKLLLTTILVTPSINVNTLYLNSPDLSTYLSKKFFLFRNVIQKWVRRRGFPPFFKGEYFELFWIADILNSSGLLHDQTTKDMVLKKYISINQMGPYRFNSKKGFTISPNFLLYDLDTTAVGVKVLNILGKENPLDDIGYYEDKDQIKTYRNDNRESVSVLSHFLSYCSLYKYPRYTHVLTSVRKAILAESFVDKFHTSEFYTLYTVLTGLVDLHLKITDVSKEIDNVLKIIIKKSKRLSPEHKLFYEEQGWIILSLSYYVENFQDKEIEILLKQKLRETHELVPDNAPLWVLKTTYSCNNLNDTLELSLKYLYEKWCD